MTDLSLNAFDHIIFIIVGILMPLLSYSSSKMDLSEIEMSPEIKRSMYYSNSLFLWFSAIIVLTVWIFSSRSLAALGFQFPMADNLSIWGSLALLFIVLYSADTLYNVIPNQQRMKTLKRWKKNTPFLPANNREFRWFLSVAFSAGICEEIVYRGFLINYFMELFSGLPNTHMIAVTLPAFIFGFAHIYQGHKAVLKVFLMALLFGFIFLYSGSILLLIILHILVDIIGGQISVHLFKKEIQ